MTRSIAEFPLPLSQCEAMEDESAALFPTAMAGALPARLRTWAFVREDAATLDSLVDTLRQRLSVDKLGVEELLYRVLTGDLVVKEPAARPDVPTGPLDHDHDPDPGAPSVVRRANALLLGTMLYRPERFAHVALPSTLRRILYTVEAKADAGYRASVMLAMPTPSGRPIWCEQRLRVNRMLLEAALPPDIYPSLPRMEDARFRRLLSAVRSAANGGPTALCLSGGGIRSATFSLGVLQALAARGLLGQFDYLSTVSGGGYIGGWLRAWMHRRAEEWTVGAAVRGPVGSTDPECVGAAEVIGELARKQTPAKEGVTAARTALGPVTEPEPEPVRFLRRYSSYLAPRAGAFSADAWTVVATFGRNVMLNWLWLVPALLFALLLPQLYLALFRLQVPVEVVRMVTYLAVVTALIPIAYATRMRPSGFTGTPGPAWPLFRRPESAYALQFCVPFMLATAAVLLSLAWMWTANRAVGTEPAFSGTLHWKSAIFGVRAFIGGWAVGEALRQLDRRNQWRATGASVGVWSDLSRAARSAALHAVWIATLGRRGTRRPIAASAGGRAASTMRWHSLVEAAAFLVVGMAAGAAVWAIVAKVPADAFYQRLAYGWLVGPCVMFALLGAGQLFVGLAGRVLNDEDREWWARAGAVTLMWATVWLAWTTVAIPGPLLLTRLGHWVQGAGALATVVSVVVGFFGGRGNSPTRAAGSIVRALQTSTLGVAAFVAVVFIVVGLQLGSSVALFRGARPVALANDSLSIGRSRENGTVHAAALDTVGFGLPEWLVTEPRSTPGAAQVDDASASRAHVRALAQLAPWRVALAAAIALALATVMGCAVDMNRFSLHGLYRMRLVRAYLGATRRERFRDPDPVSGFDEHDNVPMYALWPSPVATHEGGHDSPDVPPSAARQAALTRDEGEADSATPVRRPPLHLVNVALNLVSGRRLDWQQRKAASFTISPLHAGSSLVGFRPLTVGTNTGQPLYYGGANGISLGTAMAISGAAVSPNMGYHSSPALTFLLTFFNVRLGWWLPNTGVEGYDVYEAAAPRLSYKWLVLEALGLTNADRSFVYTSDGGHFDNLGLYEVVRRRCRFVVVSDASADPECGLSDLANAIRKIRVDLGIPITLNAMNIRSRAQVDEEYKRTGVAPESSYMSVGRIHYCKVDAAPGEAPDHSLDGILVYLKPALYGAEPCDVVNYGRESETFPHETTARQWFTESEFESYRALGAWVVDTEWNNINKAFHEVRPVEIPTAHRDGGEGPTDGDWRNDTSQPPATRIDDAVASGNGTAEPMRHQ